MVVVVLLLPAHLPELAKLVLAVHYPAPLVVAVSVAVVAVVAAVAAVVSVAVSVVPVRFITADI